MQNEGIQQAVQDKVKAKYLERFEEFISNTQDKIEEVKQVQDVNQEVLDVLEASEIETPGIKEAMESFKQVIEMSKTQRENAQLKLEAAFRLEEQVKQGKSVNVLSFLVDFDKMAGQ